MGTPASQTVTSPWAAHRRRGEALRDRHPHAGQVLALYLALLEVWEDGWRLARAERPAPAGLAGWAADRVAPAVVATTVHSGPEPLAVAVSRIDPEPALAGWLAGDPLPPVERYLARAVLRGPLEAVDAAAACAADPAPGGGRHCPSCGGKPQLSYRAGADDALVSGRRYLVCVRCGQSWAYASNSCAGCGETAGARRTVFTEHRDRPVIGRGSSHAAARSRPGVEGAQRPSGGSATGREQAREPREHSERQHNSNESSALFPHLRIEACESCDRYLIDVDLGLDARAVPEVDELAAVPLDLFAAERGLEKVAPNLMGF